MSSPIRLKIAYRINTTSSGPGFFPHTASMIAHTIRTAITVNIVLTSLSESAHYVDGIVYTAMSFLCRKTTTHCRCPTPVGVCTALLRSFYTAFTANRVCPVPCTKPFLLFFREAENPCAVFALNVLCHLKQLLLFFRDEAPSLHKKMACLPTTKKTRHQRHSCRRNQPKPTTVSSYYLSQRVYP